MLNECQCAFFVSFAFSADAVQECNAFHASTEPVEIKRTGQIIKLLTAQSRRGGSTRA